MGKPKPFSRPGINLDKSTKQWQTVTADRLSVGDTVADHGEIDNLERHGNNFYVHYVSGSVAVYHISESVFSFTEG